MNKHFKYLEIIEKYLSGELSEQEAKDFEKELMSNKRLVFEFEEYNKIREAIKDKESIKLRKQLSELGNNPKPSYHFTRIRSIPAERILLAAAVILVLIVAGFILARMINRDVSPADEIADIGESNDLYSPYDTIDSTQNINDLTLTHDTPSVDDTVDLLLAGDIAATYDLLASMNVQDLKGPEYQVPLFYSELLGTNLRSVYFSLTEPEDSAIFHSGDEIKFIWEEDSDEPLILDLIDHNGKVIYKSDSLNDNEFLFKEKLKPGVYVVRFRTVDEIIYLNVFFIINQNINK
jgi:hypothetical protein